MYALTPPGRGTETQSSSIAKFDFATAFLASLEPGWVCSNNYPHTVVLPAARGYRRLMYGMRITKNKTDWMVRSDELLQRAPKVILRLVPAPIESALLIYATTLQPVDYFLEKRYRCALTGRAGLWAVIAAPPTAWTTTTSASGFGTAGQRRISATPSSGSS